MGAALDAPANQSRHFQCLDVFRRGRKGHAEWTGELADAALRQRQTVKHRPPCGVRQGLKHGIESFGVMFNHVVEYSSGAMIVNRKVE